MNNWMRIMRIMSCVAGLLSSGCATAYPNGQQACAGINSALVSYNATSGQLDAELCGGKENDRVELAGKTPDGLAFSYAAEGAKAFEGQLTQADLRQALSRERAETIRELISVVKSLAPVASATAQ